MLVGRVNEQKLLENVYQSKRAELLALYGRRRIGKTFLVKHFFSKKKTIFFHVTGIKDGSLSEQIARFIKVMGEIFYKGSEIKEQKNWFGVFDTLTDTINKHVDKTNRIVMFFDEFPWMATHKSKLLQALDHFWNHYWSTDSRIKVIICGSSASWIIKNIIDNKGGLHNRVTRRILLKPFTLQETKSFLKLQGIKLNNWHIAQIYMVTGGIPFYLSFLEKGKSSAQLIESVAFLENSPLLTEFSNLFASLFDNEEHYIELLRIISQHRYGISQSEIAKQSNHFTKGGRITTKLKELADAGFIKKFKSHYNKKKGIYYRVIDEYTLFYLHWIEPIKDTLQESAMPVNYWLGLQQTPAWYSWSGYAFEAIVYKHILQVREKLRIPPTALSNSWQYVYKKEELSSGAQIDLLFDRQDQAITLCEIKYTLKEFVIDKSYYQKLINKKKVFLEKTKTKKQIFFVLISACGVKENLYFDEIVDDVVTLNDLFLQI